MTRSYTALLHLSLALSLTSCAFQRPQVWYPDERSGLGSVTYNKDNVPEANSFERTISMPVDPKNPSAKSFDLYYFVRMPTTGRAVKSILYLPGGPGEFIPGPFNYVTIADFLVNNGYNVVYFHARGTGFSQIPTSNRYDKFLKTSYVIEDIEAVRQDLIRQNFLRKDGKWDAVIGYSYGTVVAQQYAGTYKSNLERLILIGVQSRHGFQSSNDAFAEITRNIRDTNRFTLEKIFQRTKFNDLRPDTKSDIIDQAYGTDNKKGIFQIAEEKFGSLGFLISEYCELKDRKELGELEKYGQQFFRALRSLRLVGWLPTSEEFAPTNQVTFGMRIKDAILGTPSGATACGPGATGSSADRVFNVVNIYDGINITFLE